MSIIRNKFITWPFIDTMYVSAVSINLVYKGIRSKSGSTQQKLAKDLNLEQYLIIWKRHKDKNLVGTIASRVIEHFVPQAQELYLNVDELESPKEGRHKDTHIELLRLINTLPDLPVTSSQADDDEDDQPPELSDDEDDQPPEPRGNKDDQPSELSDDEDDQQPELTERKDDLVLAPIIELAEHEMFRDANDEVFHIEVRGERTKDKILFKAKDVAVFADNARLVEIILRDDLSNYKLEKDYKIIAVDKGQQCFHSENTNSSKNSSISQRIKHDNVYLTTAGLIRVAAVSRNANANLVKLFDWLQHLFYVNKFGSVDERTELAQDLLKSVLNDRLSGLYCIDLGSFEELYDAMSISQETYPPEQYNKYRLYKYGMSKDIYARLKQHQNKTSGYGRWCNNVSLKWMVLMSDSQLPEAESLLAEKFKAKSLSFDYTDHDGKRHTELVSVGPRDDAKVKAIYKQTISYFPSRENDLCKHMEEMRTHHELALLKLEYDFSTKLNSANDLANGYRHENELLKSEMTVQSLTYRNEMLQMQLKMSQANLLWCAESCSHRPLGQYSFFVWDLTH